MQESYWNAFADDGDLGGSDGRGDCCRRRGGSLLDVSGISSGRLLPLRPRPPNHRPRRRPRLRPSRRPSPSLRQRPRLPRRRPPSSRPSMSSTSSRRARPLSPDGPRRTPKSNCAMTARQSRRRRPITRGSSSSSRLPSPGLAQPDACGARRIGRRRRRTQSKSRLRRPKRSPSPRSRPRRRQRLPRGCRRQPRRRPDLRIASLSSPSRPAPAAGSSPRAPPLPTRPSGFYLSGAFIGDAKTNADGRWTLTIKHGLTPGGYALRADAINPKDAGVLARAEVPFDYAISSATPPPSGALVAEAEGSGAPSPADVVVDAIQTDHVVRGNTLWGESQKFYGDGSLYRLIFAANASQIKNPNLIYPGQVFVVPKEPKP